MLRKTDQARKITEEFGCHGLGTVREGDVWIIAGVPIPPPLELRSTEFTGAIPHDAIRYDQAAHEAYIKANTPRPEPPATTWWTEPEVKTHLGLSDSQFAAAKASGFPKSNGRRDRYDADGVPAGSEPLWSPELARKWATTIRSLQTAGR